MDSLVAGTIELYSVEVGDRLSNVTDLSSYVVMFKVTDEDEEVTVVNWTSSGVVISGMRIDCLIDTTNSAQSGPWPEGTYKLFVKINIPPEVPILGPFELSVS